MRFPTLSPRFFSIAFSLSLLSVPAFTQITGSHDYSLGGSSVMWIPRPSALYLNPAELGRLHQDEFSMSTNKLSNMASFSAAHFEPFFGTFAAGVANYGPVAHFSAGYARVWYQQHTAGGALNISPDAPEKVSLSLGAAAHFADSSSRNSGLHAGVSLLNLAPNVRSSTFGFNAGAAYWIRPDLLRIQAAFLQQDKPSGLLGIEVRLLSWLSFQLGTPSFKQIAGGVSVALQYISVEVGGGKDGFLLSFNLRMSDLALDNRTKNYELGLKAYQEERYFEARQFLLTAVQYDEYFSPAKNLEAQASTALQTNATRYLVEGKDLEEKGNNVEALARYSQVVKMDPNNTEAQSRLVSVKSRVQDAVKQLISAGDSLMELKSYERAQKTYEQALAMDPENESISPRLQDVAILLKQSTQFSLGRAKSLLDRNQLDDAQKEYERILASEPRNTQARSGLETIRIRRLNDLLEKGKTAFNEARFFDALSIFTEVLQRDEKNRDAKSYFDKTREALQPEADRLFKTGLQFYVKENYKSALEAWDKALLIQPQHQATLEYYKRAQDKQKAIEKLEKEN